MTDITTHSIKELAAKARAYDNIQNEGGEGYNPYRNEMDRRDYAAAAAEPRTQDTVIQEIERIKASLSPTSSDGWGPGSAAPKLKARLNTLETELAEIEAADEAAFLAVWTLDVTTARRAEWNHWIKSAKPAPGDWKAICDKERDLGWRIDEAKRAVKMHNL